LTKEQVYEAIAVYEANHGILEGRGGFKDCVAGTHIVNQMCELVEGVLEQYQAFEEADRPPTAAAQGVINIYPPGMAPIEVPWVPGMLTKDVKDAVFEATQIQQTQQRLMFPRADGTDIELKALNQTTGAFLPLPSEVTAGATLKLVLGLFAKTGGAARIGFAVDLSGSMGCGVGDGHTRMSVVNQHLTKALEAHQRPGNYFGIATFVSSCSLPLGTAALEATPENIARATSTVAGFRAGGGNGGEAACLRALVDMNVDAVFFLGDGGWSAQALIAEAHRAKEKGVKINSIAFYTTGGGLEEIAQITGGEWRQVNDIKEFHVDNGGGAADW
jgi:hypothetical protein